MLIESNYKWTARKKMCNHLQTSHPSGTRLEIIKKEVCLSHKPQK